MSEKIVGRSEEVVPAKAGIQFGKLENLLRKIFPPDSSPRSVDLPRQVRLANWVAAFAGPTISPFSPEVQSSFHPRRGSYRPGGCFFAAIVGHGLRLQPALLGSARLHCLLRTAHRALRRQYFVHRSAL